MVSLVLMLFCCVSLCCVVGGRHGSGECMQRNFIWYSWMCVRVCAFDCLCNLNHSLFVERMPNEWNRWRKSMAQKHELANHVVKVKCGEQKQWENMHYRSRICVRKTITESVKKFVNANGNVNGCARCCSCSIFFRSHSFDKPEWRIYNIRRTWCPLFMLTNDLIS